MPSIPKRHGPVVVVVVVFRYGYRKSKCSLSKMYRTMSPVRGDYSLTSSESSSWLTVLAVREKSDRAVGPFLLFLEHVNIKTLDDSNFIVITHCLLICLCLKPASFWLAGLRIASDGEMYVPLALLCIIY